MATTTTTYCEHEPACNTAQAAYIAGKIDYHQYEAELCEVCMRFRLCSCGSKQERFPINDGYGIFLTYGCEECEQRKVRKYRPDIMEHYQCDEPIEPEDY